MARSVEARARSPPSLGCSPFPVRVGTGTGPDTLAVRTCSPTLPHRPNLWGQPERNPLR